jgi:acyl-CoA synthetase (AMP-forming)/AMP-acid ligase II/thioesterase domain-containing protein/acyl carrier protein
MASPRETLDPVAETIPAAFRAAVERYGDRCALEAGSTHLTFEELDALSNGVAHRLLERGGDAPLAMVAPLEPETIVVMLGALKAGRPFVPLDPRDPPERVRLISERLRVSPVSAGDLLDDAARHEDDPGLPIDPYQPSLINFTSGSTGRPKGTVKSHRQLVWAPVACAIEPGDRVAVTLPLSFGAASGPAFGALLGGACGCLFDPAVHGIEAAAGWIAKAGITIHMTSTSALRAMVASLEQDGCRAESLRLLLVGGEPCGGHDLRAARSVMPDATVGVVYGSTEAGFIATTLLEPGIPLDDGPIPFERIYPWQEVEVVGESGDRAPAGEPGEIVVRGPDISLGYWEDPEEEARRFAPADGRARAVRTGDRGRLLHDGRLEHLGRVDLRVKVRGQMVDPQAVEHALGELPDVGEAVVSAVSVESEIRLVAHVLPREQTTFSAPDIRTGLAEVLPPYMIPSTFVRVGEIPRNLWGKIDRDGFRRAALAACSREGSYTSPDGPREEALADVVGRALGVERVGASDDLFELGLDSMSMTEILVGIHDQLGVDLKPHDLLAAPTIEALAQRVDTAGLGVGTLCPLGLGGSGTPFFCVPGGDYVLHQLLPLAHRLRRPTYSFVPRGFERRSLPDRTVERVAARFVRALRDVQPHGPYLIGGYSFGTVTAFEMAHRLRASGEQVALLVLLDPTWLPFRYGDRLRRWAADPGAGGRGSLAVGWRVARQLAVSLRVRARAATAGIVSRPYADQCRIFLELSSRQGRRYRPTPYDGPALVLSTRDRDLTNLVDMTHLLIGETRVLKVSGTHDSMVQQPHVDELARLLRETLAAADIPGPEQSKASSRAPSVALPEVAAAPSPENPLRA